MNRAQRRAEAAKVRAARVRHAAVADVLELLRMCPEDVTGATVALPTGEVLHLDAATARATAPAKGARH